MIHSSLSIIELELSDLLFDFIIYYMAEFILTLLNLSFFSILVYYVYFYQDFDLYIFTPVKIFY
jgi:hypothetical protein